MVIAALTGRRGYANCLTHSHCGAPRGGLVSLPSPSPPGYDGGMKDSKIIWLGFSASLFLIFGFPIWLPILWGKSPSVAVQFFAVSGAIVGSTSILLIIRWANCQSDRRRAKRPPDAP